MAKIHTACKPYGRVWASLSACRKAVGCMDKAFIVDRESKQEHVRLNRPLKIGCLQSTGETLWRNSPPYLYRLKQATEKPVT